MRNARTSSIFVALFAALIVLPTLQKELGVFSYEPLDEHRGRREKPMAVLIPALFETDYARRFEEYFNDTYGFRDWLIKLKNQTDYSVFRRSDTVLFGGAGMMDYRGLGQQEIVASDRLNAQAWENITARLRALEDALRERGAQLVVMVPPYKFDVYPELAPSGWASRPPHNSFHEVMDRVRAAKIPLVELMPALVSARDKRIFLRTDFHWSELGAAIAAKEAVATIAALSGSTARWDRSFDTMEGEPILGGLNRALAIFTPPIERDVLLVKAPSRNGDFLTEVDCFNVHYRAQQDRTDVLPSTLFLGNSFVDNYFKPTGVYEYFEQSYFMHSTHASRLFECMPRGTKYVVLEFLQANISGELSTPSWWPAEVEARVKR